jgi:hypothetical protein
LLTFKLELKKRLSEMVRCWCSILWRAKKSSPNQAEEMVKWLLFFSSLYLLYRVGLF